jgi:hypothetical protein
MCDLLANKQAACKTYIDQTKQLITLASAFVVAPAGLITVLKNESTVGLSTGKLYLFLAAESALIVSVLSGYITMGCVAGSQDQGSHDIYRPATRIFSLVQIGAYIVGLAVFLFLFFALTKSAPD